MVIVNQMWVKYGPRTTHKHEKDNLGFPTHKETMAFLVPKKSPFSLDSSSSLTRNSPLSKNQAACKSYTNVEIAENSHELWNVCTVCTCLLQNFSSIIELIFTGYVSVKGLNMQVQFLFSDFLLFKLYFFGVCRLIRKDIKYRQN